MSKNLKSKTINALLWNTLDKVFTNIWYAITGIILANILFPEDFGLMGALAIFTAFANIFVDSGFSTALVQREKVTREDYSTVFYFNILISITIYFLLFFLAPVIAGYFGDERLVPLARVVFLSFIFNALGLVQTSILMKSMDMKKYALVNIISLSLSSILTLIVAFAGFAVWSLVIQILSFSLFRLIILWVTSNWYPVLAFSKKSLGRFFNIGSHVLLTSLVNTFFNSAYSAIIGSKYSLKDLGYYSQADKWSKMGTTALSQILGYAIFPALSSIQSDRERMIRVYSKINKVTSYLIFPVFGGMIIMAEPLFHTLFGTKWDASILLFQLLTLRGLFLLLTSSLNNYMTAIGRTKVIFRLEVVKDIIALIAIVCTIHAGITVLIGGQLVVGALHYALTAVVSGKYTGYAVKRQFVDMLPYMVLTALVACVLILLNMLISNHYILLAIQIVAGGTIYFLLNKLFNSRIQHEIMELVTRKKKISES